MFALATYDLADTHAHLIPDGCTATLEILSEDYGPEGSFASGDDEQDADDVAAIIRALDYTPWAWCIACITVTDGDARDTVSIGGVSYYTIKTRASGDTYYDDDTALVDFMADHGESLLTEAVDGYRADCARLVSKYCAECAA